MISAQCWPFYSRLNAWTIITFYDILADENKNVAAISHIYTVLNIFQCIVIRIHVYASRNKGVVIWNNSMLTVCTKPTIGYVELLINRPVAQIPHLITPISQNAPLCVHFFVCRLMGYLIFFRFILLFVRWFIRHIEYHFSTIAFQYEFGKKRSISSLGPNESLCWGSEQWPTFSRRHLQVDFINQNSCILTKIHWSVSLSVWLILYHPGSGNGLVLTNSTT